MTKAKTQDDQPEVSYEEAKEIVQKEDEAKKDGVAEARPDTPSGIMLEPDKTDRSILTYDASNPTPVQEKKPEKSPYKSGEPVHDRS